MYYYLSQLGASLGLDPLTFGMIFVMAAIGARVLKITVDSLLLALVFFPILFVAALSANFAAQVLGISTSFEVPYEQLSLIQYISVRDFTAVMIVTFVGMLVGLVGILGLYHKYGHAG